MITVLSQNTMCWEHDKGALFKDRRPLIKKAAESADIICFQEVTPFWKDAFEEDLAGYDSILVYRGEKSCNHEAVPIYWKAERFDKIDCGHFWLSETPEVESIGWNACCLRICCWVILRDKADGREFAVVNTHLDHVSEEARINGIRLVREFITKKFGEDMPLVLMGDFNAEPGSATIEAADALLTDASLAAGVGRDENTFHGFGLERACRIDYIYLSSGIGCSKCEIVKETDGKSVQSDHYGLRAVLEIG